MENNYPIHIFISWAKTPAGYVGGVLKKLLDNLYKEEVESGRLHFFYSEYSMKGGLAQKQIIQSLSKTKLGILILTHNNLYSPWLLYEAGAIIASNPDNDNSIIPFLFERNEIEDQLKGYQAYKYSITESRESNYKRFKDFIYAINYKLQEYDLDNKTRFINKVLDEEWESIEQDFYKTLKSEIRTNSNLAVYFSERKKTYTPYTLQNYFEDVLDSTSLKHYRKQDSDDKSFNAHKVLFGDTRVSTFVTFTDGKQILFYDRRNEFSKIEIINERYDVFGSIQFENRSISKKISPEFDDGKGGKCKNQILEDFLNTDIKDIKPIYGVALENNVTGISNIGHVQSSVMIGIFAYMESSKLEEIVKENNTLFLIDIQKKQFTSADEKLYTSKAWLSIKQLRYILNK